MAGEYLKEFLDKLRAALGSSHTNVRAGDKSVTFRSAAELREQLKIANELDEGPQTVVVAKPRRPRR